MLLIPFLVLQIVGHHNEEAAARMHAWLERTSFFKVPRSHQDEVADQCGKLFEQVGKLSSDRSTDAAYGQSRKTACSREQQLRPCGAASKRQIV